MKDVFIGRPLFWSLWAILIAVLYGLGKAQLHTRDFKTFLTVLVGMVVISVLTIVLGYRKGERITREKLEDD